MSTYETLEENYRAALTAFDKAKQAKVDAGAAKLRAEMIISSADDHILTAYERLETARTALKREIDKVTK